MTDGYDFAGFFVSAQEQDVWFAARVTAHNRLSSGLVFGLQCKCLDPKNQGGKPACALPDYKGDGNCDDENNNKGCAYDGGDCCAKTVKGGQVKKNYCNKVGL